MLASIHVVHGCPFLVVLTAVTEMLDVLEKTCFLQCAILIKNPQNFINFLNVFLKFHQKFYVKSLFSNLHRRQEQKQGATKKFRLVRSSDDYCHSAGTPANTAASAHTQRSSPASSSVP
ncbi:hypothetical protein AVEN_39948-1 [Araneus ventricosus]|uniref:Uncharacterized protein n=1 Tax=Araneus ventricosus TaxID=182803 RepID=A0A4Y2XET6_ARAVE|nr:hypothetical protein AVEN_39948-1 [Araneus ventricosus]